MPEEHILLKRKRRRWRTFLGDVLDHCLHPPPVNNLRIASCAGAGESGVEEDMWREERENGDGKMEGRMAQWQDAQRVVIRDHVIGEYRSLVVKVKIMSPLLLLPLGIKQNN